MVLRLEGQLTPPTPILNPVHLRVDTPLFASHAVTLGTAPNRELERCTGHYFLLGERRTEPLRPERDPVLKTSDLNGITSSYLYLAYDSSPLPYCVPVFC